MNDLIGLYSQQVPTYVHQYPKLTFLFPKQLDFYEGLKRVEALGKDAFFKEYGQKLDENSLSFYQLEKNLSEILKNIP